MYGRVGGGDGGVGRQLLEHRPKHGGGTGRMTGKSWRVTLRGVSQSGVFTPSDGNETVHSRGTSVLGEIRNESRHMSCLHLYSKKKSVAAHGPR